MPNYLNHEDFWRLKTRFTFYELQKGEKNVCSRIRFSAIAHLQEASLAARLEIVLDSRHSAYGQTYNKTFLVLKCLKKYT